MDRKKEKHVAYQDFRKKNQKGERAKMIQEKILELTEYGLVTGLIEKEDELFTRNRLLELFELDELEDEVVEAYAKREPMTQESAQAALEGILAEMMDYAYEHGIMKENSIVYRDLFDTKIMSLLMPRPSEVRGKFKSLYENESPQAATDYFYKLSCDSIWNTRYHHQPFQAGKRSKGNCCSKTCKTEWISKMLIM